MIISPTDKFGEISKLVEYIPIAADFPSNGRFIEGTNIDSEIQLRKSSKIMFKEMGLQIKSSQGKISFRDILKLLNNHLRHASWHELVTEQRHSQLKEIGCSYPITYLLFDFCLTALALVNEKLVKDLDVRKLLTSSAKLTEPRNAELYLDTFGERFRK